MNVKKTMIALVAICIILSACTDNLKDLNYDKKLITDELLAIDANEGGFQLPGMQLGIIDVMETWRFEMQQNLNADNYAGYLGFPTPYADNRNNFTYAMIDSWNNQIWLVPSTKVLDQWVSMKKRDFDVKYPDLFALATLFKVFAGHRLTDTFGPIPYRTYGVSSDVTFDSVEDIYDQLFEELNDVVEALEQAETANPNADKVRYAKFDKSRFGGNYKTWIKVANTLRLRLAIRISGINPVKAKQEAEIAVKGGVLSTQDGSFEMTTGTVHPLFTISESWQETRLNASLESFMVGFEDPRLPKYAKPAEHTSFKGQFKGVRSGSSFEKGSFNEYSKVNFDSNPFVKVMDVAESYFLRSEGALRGWDMGGTAQKFYNEGIQASFTSNNAGNADAYLLNNTKTPMDYKDPINPVNNATALSKVTVKWDEAAPFETKLERIITQKWIALYPEGQEAWSEFRRTGYPKLWPVVLNFSNGDVPAGQFIKRIPYPTAITNSSKSSVDEAVKKFLGGKDSMYSPLWWDNN
jgi:hypothetical protein